MPTFHLVFADAAAVAAAAAELGRGRAFVPGRADGAMLEIATLVLARADGVERTVRARVVFETELPDGPRVGLELVDLDAVRGALERLSDPAGPTPPAAPQAGPDTAGEDADDAETTEFDAMDLADPSDPSDASDDDEAEPSDEAAEPQGSVDPKVVRLRKLDATARARLAREGHLEDRVLLERLFGKIVWEDLLRNPALTPPEAARIAAKGTLPRPVLEALADSPLARQGLVRKALLQNPRLGVEGATRLLRGVPKLELRAMAVGAAYPQAVRTLVKRLLAE